MWFVLSFLTLHAVSSEAIIAILDIQAHAGFGRSYLGNSRLCHQWNCINEQLNFTDSLPPKDDYAVTIGNLLPLEWRELGDSAVEICYGNKPKNYTNTCPGQALMHCVVDYLVTNCLATKMSEVDNCAPVSSIAVNNYMFSQSRYNDLEQHLLTERRPSWFLRNFFNTKCCELPPFLSEQKISKCGFRKLLHYHIHTPQTDQPFRYSFPRMFQTLPVTTEESGLQIVDALTEAEETSEEKWDPLECSDLSGFIENEWRNECHFEMSWNVTQRLGIIDVSSHEPPTTTTERLHVQRSDVKVIPLSCVKETCVFKKLKVISESGEFDTIAFTKLLDNMTDSYPDWNKAKARVVTQCLAKLHRVYDSECRINEVLGCVFDVLSENCPHLKANDPCKQKDNEDTDIICQISNAKYAPRLRREFCSIPNLIPSEVLSQCGVTSISTIQYVPKYKKTLSNHWKSEVNCRELTRPTSCLLKKMGVLNKYGFMDYFKMKDLIQKISVSPLYELYYTVLLSTPLYQEYCSSPKKLLNIIDFMLMTIPETKRKDTLQCKKIFHEMHTTTPPNMTKEQLANLFYKLQDTILSQSTTQIPSSKINSYQPVKEESHTNRIYDFGILGSENAPPVKIIDLKPKSKTLVVLPVYQRMNKTI